ncbi:MAG: PPC domain-containing protein, partial [Gloeomargarita sp. DG02_1_bins_92]
MLSPVQSRLQAIASSDDFFNRVLGEKANSTEIQAIRAQWLAGDFSLFPTVRVLDANEMGGAFGAYSQANQTIYLSGSLLEASHEASDALCGATGVLIEETFHWLDSLVGEDTPGDEGELARHLIFGSTLDAEELSRIRQKQDQGVLNIQGEAIAVEFSTDLAGNTLSTARNITLGSTTRTFNDWVGSVDTHDFYKFTLNETSEVRFSLTGLTGDANLGLLNAQGQWVTWSWNGGTANESIVRALAAGTYYLGVYSNSTSAHYTLSAAATALPDWAGNTFNTARNITLGSTTQTFNDWVGSVDTHDFYKFTLNETSEVRFSLTGLTGDANLGLLN